MWRPWKLCHFERGKFWQWTWKVMDHEIGICCDGVWEFSCTWWLEARLKITNLFRNDLNPIIREVIERNLGNFRHCRKGGVSKTKILLKWCLHIYLGGIEAGIGYPYSKLKSDEAFREQKLVMVPFRIFLSMAELLNLNILDYEVMQYIATGISM